MIKQNLSDSTQIGLDTGWILKVCQITQPGTMFVLLVIRLSVPLLLTMMLIACGTAQIRLRPGVAR